MLDIHSDVVNHSHSATPRPIPLRILPSYILANAQRQEVLHMSLTRLGEVDEAIAAPGLDPMFRERCTSARKSYFATNTHANLKKGTPNQVLLSHHS